LTIWTRRPITARSGSGIASCDMQTPHLKWGTPQCPYRASLANKSSTIKSHRINQFAPPPGFGGTALWMSPPTKGGLAPSFSTIQNNTNIFSTEQRHIDDTLTILNERE
jgi:hypothetical protein